MPAKDSRYQVAPLADADLEEIWLFGLQTWSADQADSYYLHLIEKFEMLAANPQMGPEQQQVRPPVRLFPAGSHLIIYRVEPDCITIVRVVHNRSNWRALLGS